MAINADTTRGGLTTARVPATADAAERARRAAERADAETYMRRTLVDDPGLDELLMMLGLAPSPPPPARIVVSELTGRRRTRRST